MPGPATAGYPHHVLGGGDLRSPDARTHRHGPLPGAATPGLFQNSDTVLVESHLYLQQTGVEAAPVNQLVVCARFRNPSLVEHQNTIRLKDGAQPVCDHDGGLAPEQAVDPLLHLAL